MSTPILDKIIETKKQDFLTNVNPAQLITELFAVLNDREREVLQKRFGLLGNEKHTLEKIGKGLDVTRERVRQIEISSIRKVKKHNDSTPNLKALEDAVVQILMEHEGLMAKHYLLNLLLAYSEASEANKVILDFIITKLLDERVNTKDEDQHFESHWYLSDSNQDETKQMVAEIVDILNEVAEPAAHDMLANMYKDKTQTVRESLEQYLLLNLLNLAQPVKQDIFGNWGLKNWNTVTPKRISDKIYIVLRQHKKALHFTDIAKLINDMKFDRKIAYPATVHNELILNDKYVLIGRGIYALSEWGYEPGVVADVVHKILEDNGALTREDIVKKVLEQRQVGKSTIHLALMNKDRFQRNEDNTYTVITNN